MRIPANSRPAFGMLHRVYYPRSDESGMVSRVAMPALKALGGGYDNVFNPPREKKVFIGVNERGRYLDISTGKDFQQGSDLNRQVADKIHEIYFGILRRFPGWRQTPGGCLDGFYKPDWDVGAITRRRLGSVVRIQTGPRSSSDYRATNGDWCSDG